MPFSQNNQSDFSDNSLPIIRETFEDKKMISKNKTSTAKNAPVEVRFVKPMGCKFDEEEEDLNSYHGRIGPAELTLWWNPSDPFERPPYTYATVIAHAILSSKTGRLTVDEIYNWIAETYPYYKLDKRGWKNSIRHNLSLKKDMFVKTDRKPLKSRPGRGSYWMVLKSAEKDFVDSLSQTGKYGGKMSGIEHYVMNSTSNPDSGNDAIMGAQNIQISSYSQDNKAMSPIPKFRNMSHDRSYPVPPPNTEPRSFVFRLDQPENNPRYFRKNTSGPPPKPGKRRKSGNSSCSEHDDGNDSAVETDYQQPSKRNRANPAMYQSNDETTMPSPVDFIGDILSLTQDLEFPYPYPTPEDNLIYGLQESVLQTGDRIIDLQTGSFSKQVHCPIGFDESEFSNPNSCYYGMNDTNYLPIDFYEPSTQIEPIDNTPTNIYWPNGLPLDQFDQLEQFDQFDQFDQFVQC